MNNQSGTELILIFLAISVIICGVIPYGFKLISMNFRRKTNARFKNPGENAYLVKQTEGIPAAEGLGLFCIIILFYTIDIPETYGQLFMYIIAETIYAVCSILNTSGGNKRILVFGENITVYRLFRKPVSFKVNDILEISTLKEKQDSRTMILKTKTDKIRFFVSDKKTNENSEKFYLLVTSVFSDDAMSKDETTYINHLKTKDTLGKLN